MDISLDEIFIYIKKLEDKVNEMDKANKKNILTINMLDEEIKEKNDIISKVSNKASNLELWQENSTKYAIETMDDFEEIYNFALLNNNKALLTNISLVKDALTIRMKQLGIIEIEALGKTFDPKYHECIKIINDDSKKKYEIVDMVKKGYIHNGNIIRVAKVIAVK
ncbi:nucleotide exchange factor GrpE [Clostridium sp. 19966]|uniref:nucleotide exchange factor GrpE n=1 Tax=Clostridium sp. 19966 TaxID=2768166 RepID=UPI0028DFE5FB|nr:nucleotide exchange factor GrpE [Clostridium sp. 19966]MDT8716306.1 nucleotide exchange factor GrpE [Clostridium sp. 19966]